MFDTSESLGLPQQAGVREIRLARRMMLTRDTVFFWDTKD